MLQDARRTEAAQGGPTTYTGVTIAKALGQAGRLLGEVQTPDSARQPPGGDTPDAPRSSLHRAGAGDGAKPSRRCRRRQR
jgi:hypothetical protein